MSPEMRMRITAENHTARGFAEVRTDAVQTAEAVAASSGRANVALGRQNSLLGQMADNSRMAAFQQRNLVFQLNDVAVSLASGMNPMMVAMQQGSQIATIYGPEEGGLGRALQETGNLALRAATKLAPLGLVAAAVGTGFAAMTTEINRTAQTQVGIGDVLMATWQLASESILEDLQPVVEWFKGFWDDISPYLNTAMNWVIGQFDWAYRDIKTMWSGLPGALGDAVYLAAQSALDGVTYMVRGAQTVLNDFITDVNGMLANMGSDVSLGTFNLMDYSQLENPYAGSRDAVKAQLAANAEDVQALISGNGYTAMIGQRAQELAAASGEVENLGKAADGTGRSLLAANDNVKSLAATLGEDMRGIWTGFWSEITQGAAKGELSIASFAESAIGALGKLTDRLVSMAADGLFNMLFGQAFGFGSIAGGAAMPKTGFFPGLTGPRLFSEGGYTGSGAESAVAGVVHGGEYVFSASAVERLGVGFLDGMHKSAKGYAAGGYVSAGGMPQAANRGAAVVVQPRVVINNMAPGVDVSAQANDQGELEVTVRALARDEFASARTNGIMRQKNGISPRLKAR